MLVQVFNSWYRTKSFNSTKIGRTLFTAFNTSGIVKMLSPNSISTIISDDKCLVKNTSNYCYNKVLLTSVSRKTTNTCIMVCC